MTRRFMGPLIAGLGLFLALAAPGDAQKKDKEPAKAIGPLLRSLTAEQAADLLKGLNIEFKQSAKENVAYFDYTRNNFKIRLHLFGGGKDFMLDALFPPVPLEALNQWNLKSKYTRAILDRDKQGDYAALEANLNLAGGVTHEAVKLFLQSFDEELAAFQKFLAGRSEEGGAFVTLANDRIETILKSANIAFKKNELPNGIGMFQFKVHDQLIRLHNFAGKDIMLDAHFDKISLEAANQWNLKKKFIRTVVYNEKGKEYSAVESNLEILGGVTEAIVRQFIANFTEDVREFQAYVKNLNKKDEPKEEK